MPDASQGTHKGAPTFPTTSSLMVMRLEVDAGSPSAFHVALFEDQQHPGDVGVGLFQRDVRLSRASAR